MGVTRRGAPPWAETIQMAASGQGDASESSDIRERQHGGPDVRRPLRELRSYCEARQLVATEFVDQPSAGQRNLGRDGCAAEGCQVQEDDLVIVWRLDRLGGNLRHLILTLDDSRLPAWAL